MWVSIFAPPANAVFESGELLGGSLFGFTVPNNEVKTEADDGGRVRDEVIGISGMLAVAEFNIAAELDNGVNFDGKGLADVFELDED